MNPNASKPEPSNIEVIGSGTPKVLVAFNKVALALFAWTWILSTTLNVERAVGENASGTWLIVVKFRVIGRFWPFASLSNEMPPVDVPDPLKLSEKLTK